jgi:hypothetical protein
MSMDMMQFVLEVEDTFDVTISDTDYEHLGTVGALVDYIAQRCPGSKPDEIFRTVQRLTWEHFSIPPEEVVPTARWVEDLKLDCAACGQAPANSPCSISLPDSSSTRRI